MVRKAKILKQKQRQSQKQIVNITLAKEPKRKPVKRRSAGRASAQPQTQQNYTGGFTPVYIQSGNLAEQNINPLIKTIEELKESIKSKPVEKQLVMRTPMKPLEYETGFDFTEDKFKTKMETIKAKDKFLTKMESIKSTPVTQQEIVKPAFIPQRLEKAEAYDTPYTLGIGRMVESINPSFSEPVITQAEIIRQPVPEYDRGGRLPKALTEDEVRYRKEKKAYDKAVSARKLAQEKAQSEGKEFKPRKKLPPPPVRPSSESTNFPYDL